MALKLKFRTQFPALVTAASPLTVEKTGLEYDFGIDIEALRESLVVPTSSKIITAPGPYAALPEDDVLIIKQTVAAPFTVTVDWSARTRPLRVVDGKGDASVNNITITPAAGQSQLAVVNYSYVIDGNGGSVILTPLPDHSGAY